MTTKEFKKRLCKLGYHTDTINGKTNIRFNDFNGLWLGTINERSEGNLFIEMERLIEYEPTHVMRLFSLIEEYIDTPIADRAEEKFYWRVKGGETLSVAEKYLWVFDEGYKRTWEFEQATHGNRYTQKEYERFVEIKLIADIFEKESIK